MAIARAVEAIRRAIRGQSEGNQRAIRWQSRELWKRSGGQSEGNQRAISGHHLQWREEPRELWKRSVGRTLIKGRLSDATIERGREIGEIGGAIRGYSEGTQRVLRGYSEGI